MKKKTKAKAKRKLPLDDNTRIEPIIIKSPLRRLERKK